MQSEIPAAPPCCGARSVGRKHQLLHALRCAHNGARVLYVVADAQARREATDQARALAQDLGGAPADLVIGGAASEIHFGAGSLRIATIKRGPWETGPGRSVILDYAACEDVSPDVMAQWQAEAAKAVAR